MTIESDIFDTLKGLVGNRVYPDVMPVSTVRPAIMYLQVGGEEITFMDGTLPSKKNSEFQIMAWANTRAEASTLIEQIAAAMCASTRFQATPTRGVAYEHEPDVEPPLYGAHRDFSIWSDR